MPEGSDRDELLDTLGARLLGDWLRNRQQLLVPLTLDLGKLDANTADLLLRVIATAAHVRGEPDAGDRARVAAALERMSATPEQRLRLQDRLRTDEPPNTWLCQVADVPTATLVYATALLALDQRDAAGAAWLRYLAARLGLARELAKNLEQRYRVAR